MIKEEKKKVRDFCKSYIPARSRIRRAEKDREKFEKHAAAEGISIFEKELMELNIARKQKKIEEDRKIVLLFESALGELDGLDRCIFHQLYVEGKQQNDVVNLEGKQIARSRVNVIKDRALERVGKLLLELFDFAL